MQIIFDSLNCKAIFSHIVQAAHTDLILTEVVLHGFWLAGVSLQSRSDLLLNRVDVGLAHGANFFGIDSHLMLAKYKAIDEVNTVHESQKIRKFIDDIILIYLALAS